MGKPRKYRLIVEVTDMYGRGFTIAQIRNKVADALDKGIHDRAYDLEGLKVKDYDRFERQQIRKEKEAEREAMMELKFNGSQVPPGTYDVTVDKIEGNKLTFKLQSEANNVNT